MNGTIRNSGKHPQNHESSTPPEAKLIGELQKQHPIILIPPSTLASSMNVVFPKFTKQMNLIHFPVSGIEHLFICLLLLSYDNLASFLVKYSYIFLVFTGLFVIFLINWY